MKNVKMTKNARKATLITHNGIFHASEVLSTVILKKVFGNVTIYRTDYLPINISEDVIVYGMSPKVCKYPENSEKHRKNGIPYSSCGLIWKDFGYSLLKNTCNPKLAWELIDKELIQSVDCSSKYSSSHLHSQVNPITFLQMISYFNLPWDSKEDSDEAFLKALDFAEKLFDVVFKSCLAKIRAKKKVEEAIENSKDHILILKHYLPWKDCINSSKNPKAKDIFFVIYPSARSGYNWHIVGKRNIIPTEWKGTGGKKLQEITGVPTATFCHTLGFIGGALTFEDTLKMVKKAMES